MAKTSRPTRAPNKALYLTDYARSAWDIGALSATLPALARAPRGDGHAVLVIPGLGATDMSRSETLPGRVAIPLRGDQRRVDHGAVASPPRRDPRRRA